MERESIFKAIEIERERQNELHPLPLLKKTNSADVKALQSLMLQNHFLAVLIEEVGEIGTALQGEGSLEEEIIQVASVCVRWLESFEN